MDTPGLKITAESSDFIDIDVGISEWQMLNDNRFILEEDFKVSGDVWRVHLNDADPYPSSPHAHCIGGTKRFIGNKLHLGTGQLFDSKNMPLNRRLAQKQFDCLIELIKPKFPNIIWPLI